MMDPKRLIDPESRSSPTLRALLRAWRSELPGDDRVYAIGGIPQGGSVGPNVGAGGAAAAGLKVVAAAKIGAVALVALGGVGGTYVLTSRQRETAARPSASAPSSAVVPAASVVAPPFAR